MLQKDIKQLQERLLGHVWDGGALFPKTGVEVCKRCGYLRGGAKSKVRCEPTRMRLIGREVKSPIAQKGTK